jgi:hypothetical protein
MEQSPPSPINGQADLAPQQSGSPRCGIVLKVCVGILALIIGCALIVFRTYGTDTHHANRNSIWWPERGRNLIPPTATDITLRRGFLDHYAIYTISERELNAFLDRRFARPGEALDSFSERSPANPENIGKAIGPLGWVGTEDTVEYFYSASNGGGHHFYHDTNTGLTYQDSAYW